MKNDTKSQLYQPFTKIRDTYSLPPFLGYYLYYYYYGKEKDRLRPLLQDERRFSNSSFSASASVEGHSASDARITSGSSWCAPVSDDKHYLQIDLKKMYRVYSVITYGDSVSPKWVAKYSLGYTDDSVNWITRVRESEITTNDDILACTILLNLILRQSFPCCRKKKETKMLMIV